MLTNKQKTILMHVKVILKWHRIFKMEAAEKGLSITECLTQFFEKNHSKGESYGK